VAVHFGEIERSISRFPNPEEAEITFSAGILYYIHLVDVWDNIQKDETERIDENILKG
jgi:hypothetical protein